MGGVMQKMFVPIGGISAMGEIKKLQEGFEPPYGWHNDVINIDAENQ